MTLYSLSQVPKNGGGVSCSLFLFVVAMFNYFFQVRSYLQIACKHLVHQRVVL